MAAARSTLCRQYLMHPALALIAAVAKNGVIGRRGRLPWRLPEDLRHFRALTTGHAILMGRRTWQSLPHALPDRQNIVITRQRDFIAMGATVVSSLEHALLEIEYPSPAFCIGGGELYRAALPFADRIVVTEIRESFDGDTHAPDVGRPPDSVGGWLESSTGLYYRFLTWS